jgi:hypothetical protein
MCTDDAAFTACVVVASKAADEVVTDDDVACDATGVPESPHPTSTTAGAASSTTARSGVRIGEVTVAA